MSVVEVTFPGNLAQVDDKDDLRALPSAPIESYELYIVRAAGLFFFDSASTAPDDDISVLKPDDLSPLQAGRWIAYVSGPILDEVAEAAAMAAAAAAAAGAYRVQTNTATPTVPPSGVTDGGYYWAVNAGQLSQTLYLNTAGTGAPVLSGGNQIIIPLYPAIEPIADILDEIEIVGDNIDAVVEVADNIDAIIAAPASAASALASATAAAASETAALGYKNDAATSAATAVSAETAVIAVASQVGIVNFYATKADANTALAGLANLAVVEVFEDESQGGTRTIYQKVSSAYVLRAILTGFRTWYVSNNGSDAASGTSPAAPLQTLAAVLSKLRNGDTIMRARGSIFREECNLSTFYGITSDDYGTGPPSITSGMDTVTSFTDAGDGTWSFSKTLPAGSLNRAYPGVFENGKRMYEIIPGDAANDAARIALVVASTSPTGAQYFVGPWLNSTQPGWAAGSREYRIKASDGSNPNSNGKVYETYARSITIDLGVARGNRILSGTVHGSFNHDGILGDQNIRNVTMINPGRHGSLPSSYYREGMRVAGMNPRYTGGLFHSNPSVMQTDGYSIDCHAMGDPLNPVGIGFYTHGSGTPIRNRAIFRRCSASNVATVFSQQDVNYVYAEKCQARNFSELLAAGTPTIAATFVDCDFRGGVQSGRITGISTGKTMTFRRSYVEAIDSHFFSLASLEAGSVIIDDTTIVLRGVDSGGNEQGFFRCETSSTRGFDALKCRRSSFILLGNGGMNWFARAHHFTALDIDQVMIAALDANGVLIRDPIITLNSTATPMSTIAGVGRVVVADPARIIDAFTEDRQGVILKPGTWQPGAKIFNAITKPNGSQAPSVYVAVGDIITTTSLGDVSFTPQAVTPTAVQNAVAYNINSGNRCMVSVGNSGTAYRSDTNAANFAAVSTGVSAHLYAIAFDTAGNGVAVGASGTVLKTADGGQTWAAATTPGTTRTMRAVATDGAGRWIAAGDEGRVITSTDNGDTWTETTVGSVSHYALIWVAGGSAATSTIATGTTYGTFTVGSVPSAGRFRPGDVLTGSGVTAGTTIAFMGAPYTGRGSTGTYGVTPSQTVSSTTISSAGRFLMGSDGGAIRSSPTGVPSWTSQSSGTENRISCFAIGELDGLIMAGIVQTTKEVQSALVSMDGVNWQDSGLRSPMDVFGIAGPGTLVSNGKGFIAVGPTEYAWFSLNGRSGWSLHPIIDATNAQLKYRSPTQDEVIGESYAA